MIPELPKNIGNSIKTSMLKKVLEEIKKDLEVIKKKHGKEKN
jgi:hypothetical protein